MSQSELPAEGVLLAELVEPVSPAQPKPWGFWATLGFSLAIIVAFVATETAVAIVFMVVQAARTPKAADQHNMEATNGLLLSVATWIAAPMCFAFVVLLVKLRNQLSIRDYLSLNRVSVGRFLAWAGDPFDLRGRRGWNNVASRTRRRAALHDRFLPHGRDCAAVLGNAHDRGARVRGDLLSRVHVSRHPAIAAGKRRRRF